MIQGGYGQMAYKLAEGLDIKLNHPVKKIKHDQKRVIAQTENGLIF